MKTPFSSGILLTLVAAIAAGGAACAGARGPGTYPPGYSGGYPGPAGMMGPGGMMGGSNGIGPGGPYRSGAARITMDQAQTIAEGYLARSGNPDLQIEEIMEFQYNFYVEFSEKSSGIHAFEALIEPYTGDMYPEPGPNMMWNTKYGMMSGMMWGAPNVSASMTVTPDQARQNAQDFLGGYLAGSKTADTPDRFYGYYTIHVLLDGQIYGMLSVNGFTGQVWYHSWHGMFLQERESSADAASLPTATTSGPAMRMPAAGTGESCCP